MPSCLVLHAFVQFSDHCLVSFFSPKHWLSGVGLLLIGATTLYGQDSWQGPVGANGDWFTGTNWTNGVPMTGVDATVNNGEQRRSRKEPQWWVLSQLGLRLPVAPFN